MPKILPDQSSFALKFYNNNKKKKKYRKYKKKKFLIPCVFKLLFGVTRRSTYMSSHVKKKKKLQRLRDGKISRDASKARHPKRLYGVCNICNSYVQVRKNSPTTTTAGAEVGSGLMLSYFGQRVARLQHKL